MVHGFRIRRSCRLGGRWIVAAFVLMLVMYRSMPNAAAARVPKIDRTIGNEPEYQNKPRYFVLLFGPQARTRVWCVLDGNVLYVDRNADPARLCWCDDISPAGSVCVFGTSPFPQRFSAG